MYAISEDVIARRAEFLSRSAFAFFDRRGLSPVRLEASVMAKFPDAEAMLITSSPVQGLATKTSDIDLVAITPDSGGGMATQIYVDGHHAEVAMVTPDIMARACRALSTVAEAPLEQAIEMMRAWNKSQPLKLKYLERAINGVAFDGSVPNSGMFPALAKSFAAQAFGRMVEAHGAMKLAFAAQERRAPWIYAMATVDHAMDVILCSAGHVYQNRKWIGSRWRLHGAEAIDAFPHLVAARRLAEYAQIALRALEAGQSPELESRLDAVLAELSEVMAFDLQAGLRQVDGVSWRKFGAGAIMGLGPQRAVMLQGNDALPEWMLLEDAERSEAGRYLSALRAGLVRVQVTA